MSLFRRLTLCAGICFWSVGCGASGEKLNPVAGKVTLNGAPLASGSVTFHPNVAKGNNTPHIPVGMIDEQGHYKLQTATKEGAPPGWYKITVSAQAPVDPKDPYGPPKHLINSKYSDPNTSGVEAEVLSTAPPGAYDLKVTK
jgi:hypothetical protein